MHSPRSKLISILIRKKLYEEIGHIISITRQGFDVHVKTDFIEIQELLIDLLENEINSNLIDINLVRDPKILNSDKVSNSNITSLKPTIFIHSECLSSGYGFVKYKVPSPDSLLSSTSSAIENILDYFGLSIFLDAFDSDLLSKLKQIAKTLGLAILIDAVVQTAYYGGFHGDKNRSLQYLDSIQLNNDEIYSKISVPIEKCAETFFSYVMLQGEDAHTFLKSSLSYYAVKLQGFSMTRASQVLQISRTTLQEHLKLADQLGVSNFFEGYRQKTI
jgi:hypothetical protein